MTTTQDTAIPLADNVIGASQGGHGLGPTSLSGRIALLIVSLSSSPHTRKSGPCPVPNSKAFRRTGR